MTSQKLETIQFPLIHLEEVCLLRATPPEGLRPFHRGRKQVVLSVGELGGKCHLLRAPRIDEFLEDTLETSVLCFHVIGAGELLVEGRRPVCVPAGWYELYELSVYIPF